MRLYSNRILILAFPVLMMLSVAAGAQESSLARRMGTQGKGPELPLLRGWGRWSFKVNSVDLLLTVPNLGIEFDLNNTKYSKSTLSLSVRYNWNEYHTYKPYNVLNVLELRPEYRRYCRGLERRKNVLYWGIYANAGTYSFKFSEKGHQGKMCGGGFSMGFVTPLSEYRKFAIDMEVGGSIGALLRTDEPYVRSEDNQAYLMLPEENKGLAIMPYPVLAELRVAFVFRKVSVRERYQLTSDERDAKRQKKMKKQNSKVAE